ncbi:MAG TPA: hypothetical protein PLZ21_12060, partial [Armatimonadota bacterium]|nr:hypothetical protein [Armatimonadota bacterium]
SNGGYLSLDTKNHPVMSQYMAAFVLDITKEGFHEIWIAGLPPDVGASPFSFSIDTGPWQQPTYDTIQPYWKEFAWMKIGAANFTKGLHLINIRVDGPGSAGYLFAIDAIVASPGVFTPDGIMKP